MALDALVSGVPALALLRARQGQAEQAIEPYSEGDVRVMLQGLGLSGGAVSGRRPQPRLLAPASFTLVA